MMNVAWILHDTIRWPEMEEDILHALGYDTEDEFSAFLQDTLSDGRSLSRRRSVPLLHCPNPKLRRMSNLTRAAGKKKLRADLEYRL